LYGLFLNGYYDLSCLLDGSGQPLDADEKSRLSWNHITRNELTGADTGGECDIL
jgi:hypothetical protein